MRAGSDTGLGLENALLEREPEESIEDKRASAGASKSFVDRASSTTSGKKVEFSVFPKKTLTWKNKGTPKWKTASKSKSKSSRTTNDVGFAVLDTRAQKVAEAGSLAQGTKDDTIVTWHVINCVAIAAYDSGTGKKVMAHINGIQGTATYKDQFDAFTAVVNSFSVTPKITIRMPVAADFSTVLSAEALKQQTTMQNKIEEWAVTLAGGAANVDVKTRKDYNGDMVMSAGGKVEVDT